ncbi:SIMPL domain-containing protein [Nocardioides sp. ChNu-153]|uniref:SIMPL domain-containing protein n=1 Tax=unclassified Nocardioides TaxID=2615069 RepID=UPI00240718B1|nr:MULTISPECIES: SIMPL domain-containing protein [unclassified Nocardioides]MDF9715593.1 SIMPL domain-containing protein [Nocardioides sp. ChNu-99]MDN7121265.1 SIMPL domain-containing protein [Nocardioides sp. ChNu-153]
MTQVEITVEGVAHAAVPPDRATVHARVRRTGPDGAQVHAEVARAAEQVVALLPADGPVRSRSVDAVVSGREDRWEREGRGAGDAPVRYALVAIRVELDDAAALARWVARASDVDGFEVAHVAWTLVPEHRAEVLARLRRAAVADARDRAEGYAAAAGLGTPRFAALADAGLLDQAGERGAWRAMSSVPGAGPGFAQAPVSPAPVELTVRVHARFTATEEDA